MDQKDRLFMKVIDSRNLPSIINKRQVESMKYSEEANDPTIHIKMITGDLIKTLQNFDALVADLQDIAHSKTD